MEITLRVRFLNFFRNIFKIPYLEGQLAKRTLGKSTLQLWSKLVPSAYLYPPGSFRIVRQNGLELKVDIGDYIGHCIYFGLYGTERKSYEKLFSLCRPGNFVVDIGANIGWTLLNLAKLSAYGKVIGFEPDAFNHEACSENLRLNGLTNVTLVRMGLGAQASRVMMEVRTPSNRGGNRISPLNGYGSTEVNIERLDDVEEIRAWPRIDLIKIDVEGYELNVLMGAEGILRREKPVLFIEIDDNNLRDQGHSAETLMQFLRKVGYRNMIHATTNELIGEAFDFKACHFDIIAR